MIEILTNEYRQPCFPAEYTAVELDMGCGKGKFTLELAQRYPERLIVGLDVMMGRLTRIDSKVGRRNLKNVMLLRAESSQAAAFQLPAQSVDRIHLLCPDPWPKKSHTIRRLVCTDFLCRVPRVLRTGGIFHLSTDYLPYFEDWRRMFAQLGSLYEECPEGIADVADLKTDFELKWNAMGQEVRHIAFRVKG